MRPLALLLLLYFSSCSPASKSVAGFYRLNADSKTKLVLNSDNSFEFVKNFTEPGPVFLPDSSEYNFRTSGTWQLDGNKQLVLNSAANRPLPVAVAKKDSIIKNTSITSLSFWDHDGDPIAIHFIKFLPDKMKFFRGNTISFFMEDFNRADTLEFHFYGYPPVKWPSRNDPVTGSNYSHAFTLYEESRPTYFQNMKLNCGKKKLISTDKSFVLYKN